MTAIPGIVTNRVTDARRVRRTANWLKALYAVLIAFVATVGLALVFASNDTANPSPVAKCELEDGSTQQVCWWHDTHGAGDIVNIDYGRWTYEMNTGDLIRYPNGRNPSNEPTVSVSK